MRTNHLANSLGYYLSRVFLVLSLVFVSSYCTRSEKQTTKAQLTGDEQFLVETLVKISQARDLHYVNPLKSDSLFQYMGGTVDTTRIATTIRALEADPDRWILVFESVEERLKPSQGQGQPEPPSE